MRQTVRIGTFYGIAVGVNWSVALILPLFAWELAVYILPTHSGHADASDWVAGIVPIPSGSLTIPPLSSR